MRGRLHQRDLEACCLNMTGKVGVGVSPLVVFGAMADLFQARWIKPVDRIAQALNEIRMWDRNNQRAAESQYTECLGKRGIRSLLEMFQHSEGKIAAKIIRWVR